MHPLREGLIRRWRALVGSRREGQTGLAAAGSLLRAPVFIFALIVTQAAPALTQEAGMPRAGPRPQGEPQRGLPAALGEVGIDQRLNEQVPPDTVFRDETGRQVRLGAYFGTRPVILALVYYECPMLCNMVLDGLAGGLEGVPFTAGDEFVVVAVSFDPRETPGQAREKKELYMARYARVGAARDGWHFLTGDEESVVALTRAVGFRYRYDPETKQYAHASGVMVLTPQGRVARYLFGVEYPPRDLRLALVEASANRVGSPVDRLLLFCYHYDPVTGKYGAVIKNILRLGALVTVITLAALLLVLRRRGAPGNRRRGETARAP